ncbi:Tripeptidyl-peptidase sed2 [Psilocybe cubensis]|uniref:Tripeptidyl-peptidase sed2 n=1 Tax=Psilocybe cubensis TaxID=181762 RepID=A0ACB8GHJ5_PSICU|nr:Tripeptidyl-peptidase sed2 [Psilocybe cubensis]KAH9474991.1 Tripeptidyl-peptidase sed2 [Psilocybe cubensis]
MPTTLQFAIFCHALAFLLPRFAFTSKIIDEWGNNTIKEVVHHPLGWIKLGRPTPDHLIALQIGLPQHNFPKLEKRLYEVSDPKHSDYGQHLSRQEVEALVSPHPRSLSAVSRWLKSFNVEDQDITYSPAKDWIKVTLPVQTVEEMLDTTYHVWEHVASGDKLVRTTSYKIPAQLEAHVDVIQPTTTFGGLQSRRSTIFAVDDAPRVSSEESTQIVADVASNITVDASCNHTITIPCLLKLYNADRYVPSHNLNNSIAVAGYLEEFANLMDLQSFYAEQRPEALNSSFTFISVAGGLNDQTSWKAGSESNLDVQFAFGISYPIPATFYSTAGRPPFLADAKTTINTNEPYGDWLDFVLKQDNLPLTISTSYGDDEQTVPESYARRICAQFAQLGARGVSLLFSSGDTGVGDGVWNPHSTSTCISNDGKNTTKFLPSFPASVTAVGGTSYIPEVAVSTWYSGGGFSDYFERPPYQDEVVSKYLSSLPNGTYQGLYNPKGRAYPDVSAQSDNFRSFQFGRPHMIGGTSAATPVVAGIVAMLNDARLGAGLSPLGFLNPMIYSRGAAGFNDITVGHNSGCLTSGFNATEGWDPVTGFGTPNFEKLKDIVTSF